MPIVSSLYRYPVKGFSPEALGEIGLEPGGPVAGDRIFAVENGPSGFDPGAPAFQPKMKFLCLMKNARLARLATRLDTESLVWTIEADGARIEAHLSTEAGRGEAEAFLTAFMGEERRGPLKVLSAPGHSFSDVGKPLVSFINLGSVDALTGMLGRTVDPLRFRANMYLADVEPWAELDWVGREAAIGATRLRFVRRTKRCVATNVDPQSAERDMDIPGTLLRAFDHMDCGVYAEVTAGGTVKPGDRLNFL